MMSHLRWLLIWVALASLATLAFGFGVEGALNVLVFVVWFTALVSLLALGLAKASPRRPEFPVRWGATCALHWWLAFTFVWHGMWWTAMAVLTVTFAGAIIRHRNLNAYREQHGEAV